MSIFSPFGTQRRVTARAVSIPSSFNTLAITNLTDVSTINGEAFASGGGGGESQYFSATSDYYLEIHGGNTLPIFLENVTLSQGITGGGQSNPEIIVPETGVYQFTYSLQVETGIHGKDDFYVWIAHSSDINTPLPNSILFDDGPNTYMKQVAMTCLLSLTAEDRIMVVVRSMSTLVRLGKAVGTSDLPVRAVSVTMVKK